MNTVEETMPILDSCRLKDYPSEIPMGLLSEEWAQNNHGQSLKRLKERGGLGYSEAIAIIEKRKWAKMKEVDAAWAVINAIEAYASQSVATPEAEIEKMADKYAGDTIFDFKGEIMVSHDDVTCETKKAFIAGYKAAIKKDEPDLVVKDDYEPSKIHPQPSSPVASHTCTDGNSIQHEADDAYCAHKWLDDLKIPTHDGKGEKYSLVGRIIAYGKMCEPQNYKQ